MFDPLDECRAQVTSNGMTVWLNVEGICRARICKFSAEYWDEQGAPLDLDMPPNWRGFVRKCSELFDVAPDRFEGHCPQWAIGPHEDENGVAHGCRAIYMGSDKEWHCGCES